MITVILKDGRCSGALCWPVLVMLFIGFMLIAAALKVVLSLQFPSAVPARSFLLDLAR